MRVHDRERGFEVVKSSDVLDIAVVPGTMEIQCLAGSSKPEELILSRSRRTKRAVSRRLL
jgi:hypothetical protein